MTVLLSASGITKRFQQPSGENSRIIGGIDLTLSAGEIVCLLGASGSGKTTLLRILAGLEAPDEGAVRSDVTRPGAQFGYLAQKDRLLPWRNVLQNTALGLELIGARNDSARSKAAASLISVGMGAYQNNMPAQLSGGMTQRVLLARLLAHQPKLLLMDEPMSSLDVLARQELAFVIKTYVRTTNAAALVVTHSVEEACFLADRILLVTRSPAKVFEEIILSDTGDRALPRDQALNLVMRSLRLALMDAT